MMSIDLFDLCIEFFLLVYFNKRPWAAMLDDINTKKQSNRLAYIDFRLFFLGALTRNDIIERFGTKEAAATRDITEYKDKAPENLKYDATNKIYVRCETFKPLFEYEPQKVLSLLAYGFGDDLLYKHNEPLIPCETPTRLNTPDLNVLSVLTRAIYQKKAIKMDYQSPNGGPSSREFVPSVLVNTGLRWHIRGFDRKRSQFSDFVITRVSSPELIDSMPLTSEKIEKDNQWNRILELEIVPHPHLKYPKSIEKDYDMQNGVLKIEVRAAIAGYLLRLWNIDCSKDHILRSPDNAISKGKEFQLWLRNWKCLYGVEYLDMVPGYEFDAF